MTRNNIYDIYKQCVNCSYWTTGQNYLWTSGALVLQKGKDGKVEDSHVFWCSSKLAKKSPVIIPANYQKNNCLAFVKSSGDFEVKNCAQKFHYFCEVSFLQLPLFQSIKL